MKYNNNSGYSVVLSLLMVGFMMILVVGVFRLVFIESRDTRGMESSIKAFAGAEGAIELALLKAKKNNYSVSEKLSDENNPGLSHILKESDDFFPINDVLISYNINSTSNIVEGTLKSGSFKIIPLFGNNSVVSNIMVSQISDEIVWNILSEDGGISGVGDINNITEGNYRSISGNEVLFQDDKKVGDFLSDNHDKKNYLILHNTGSSGIDFKVEALGSGEYLTNINTNIIGTGEIDGFKQNLKVDLNTGGYLNLLRYSLFSN